MPSPSLQKASIQDIQLELIRRTQHNALDGERVYKSLLKHHVLWQAVLLDRQGVPNYRKPGGLQLAGLVKLRDLTHNLWNADTLFVPTTSPAAARELAEVAMREGWGGELQLHEDREEAANALGGGPRNCGLLSIWWD
ncbi:MAG: hypothetical protein FJ304_10040 [Planctomycetes bacterium]|nr:hypothetical protein [Planctomycetota bacterium]